MISTAGEAEGIPMSLLEALFDDGWFFSAFDKKDGKFFKAVSKLRPGYATSHYPTREAFTGRYRDAYFLSTQRRVQSAV